MKKGKGPRLGKMRIIEMIEASARLEMRVFLGRRTSSKAEKDKILPNYDCGLRKRRSTEAMMLEKILIFDCAKKTE